MFAGISALATVAEVLAGEPQMGICIRSVSGRSIRESNAELNFIPASNLKIITTGLALKRAGTDFRFRTELAYSGEVDSAGCLHGDLYITGGGDPTLASGSPLSGTASAVFAEWAGAVGRAGIRCIDGRIIADPRILEVASPNGGWMVEDLGTYYGVSPSGLCFYENRCDFTVTPGTEVGAPVDIAPKYPQMPWMVCDNACTTGATGSGDRTWLMGSPLSGCACFVGSYGLGKPSKTVHYCNRFPEFTCAFEFAQYLKRTGIFCRGVSVLKDCHPVCEVEDGAERFSFRTFDGDRRSSARLSGGLGPAELPDSLTVIHTSVSAPLDRIAGQTNFESNNLYAETLLLLRPRSSAGTFFTDAQEAIAWELRQLGQMGVSTGGISIDDGCGLSRRNFLSPDFFCRYLSAMSREQCFGAFVRSLASPATDAATRALLPDLSKMEGSAGLHLKSGSMKGVMCYSGYLLPAKDSGEIIVFSIMMNNGTGSGASMRKAVEKILIDLLKGQKEQ